jgi:hypothetical protein
MSHLSLETLGRLIDEPPTAAERRHLESCALCRAELDAFHDDLRGLGELPDLLPAPENAWPALAARLRSEGLIGHHPAGRHRARHRQLQLAAALALFLLGGFAGFNIRGEAARGTAGLASLTETTAGGPPPPAASLGGSLASTTRPIANPARDVSAATRALEEAETAYLAALARYAELSADAGTVDPITRLAALQNIVATTRDALATAPADPLINGYHLTALAQQDATIRQLVMASNDRWY